MPMLMLENEFQDMKMQFSPNVYRGFANVRHCLQNEGAEEKSENRLDRKTCILISELQRVADLW